MLTANYMTFSPWLMKPGYVETEEILIAWGIASFGAIDAPLVLPAGSIALHNPISRLCKPFPVPTGVLRGAE